jgi:protein phosphatase
VTIAIPDPSLVLLIGPAGAGKSTFAAAHFRPTEIVSSDAIRGLLTDDEADQSSSAEAFHVLALLVHGRLKRRLTTVVDATNLRAANRKSYPNMAARYGVPTVAIAFDLDAATCYARNAARNERSVAAEVVDDQVARMPAVLAAIHDEGFGSVIVLRDGDLAEAGLSRVP